MPCAAQKLAMLEILHHPFRHHAGVMTGEPPPPQSVSRELLYFLIGQHFIAERAKDAFASLQNVDMSFAAVHVGDLLNLGVGWVKG